MIDGRYEKSPWSVIRGPLQRTRDHGPRTTDNCHATENPLSAAARHPAAGAAELPRGAGHRHPAILPPVLPAAGAAGAVVPVGLEQPAWAAGRARNLHTPLAGRR